MKPLFRALWRCAGPARRPVRRKLEALVDRCVARTVEDRVPGCVARALDADLGPVLDALLAEQFRLQAQVEDLQRLLRERERPPAPGSWAPDEAA